MAVAKFFPVIPAANGSANVLYSAAISATGNSSLITTGPGMLIRVATTGAVTIRFGTATSISATSAGATDMVIPANSTEIFDMGYAMNAVNIYAIANTNVSVSTISKN